MSDPIFCFISAEFTFYVTFAVLAIIVPIIISASNYFQIAMLVAHTSKKHTHSFSQQRQQENALLYKTMLCTITVFAILTVPYACYLVVYMTLVTFSETYFNEHQNMLTSLNYVVFTTSAFNSCVNPFIYAKYDMRMLRIRCCRGGNNRGDEAHSSIISSVWYRNPFIYTKYDMHRLQIRCCRGGDNRGNEAHSTIKSSVWYRNPLIYAKYNMRLLQVRCCKGGNNQGDEAHSSIISSMWLLQCWIEV